MLRPLIASLALLSILVSSGTAEASPGVEGCVEQACEPLLIVQATLAPAADEAEVRKRDAKKLKPPVPAFWSQFHSYAYKQLPKHQEKNFHAVWVGMPIDTTEGTVATVGVKGIWW